MFARSDACLAAEVLPTMASLASWHLWQNALSAHRGPAHPLAQREELLGTAPALASGTAPPARPRSKFLTSMTGLMHLSGPIFTYSGPKRRQNAKGM